MPASLRTPTEVASDLGQRIEALRLARNWRRATLAERAGVGLSTVQRFEKTGHITIENLLKIADALDRLHELEQLFAPAHARTLAALFRASATTLPKRGRR